MNPTALSVIFCLFNPFGSKNIVGKESRAMQETPVRFLSQESPLEKG